MFLRTHWGFPCCFLPGQLLKSSGWSNIYICSETPSVWLAKKSGFSRYLILLTLFFFTDTLCMPSTSFPAPPFLSHGSGVHFDPYILVLILFVIINATSMGQRTKYAANPHLIPNRQNPGTLSSSSPIPPESLGNSSAPTLP